MADFDFLTRAPFAHRGLHGCDAVENSRAAFEAAIAAGHGIECDVQVSKDGEAFVFHDYELDRLTRASGKVIERKAKKLETLKLNGSDETLPRLPEMLKLTGGRAPILIELKAKSRKVKKLCKSVAAALASYEGEVAVMSFNPEVGHWFAKHAPDIVRGLVITEEEDGEGIVARLKGASERTISVWRAEPHFLAYDIFSLPSAFAEPLRDDGMPVLTWTVQSASHRDIASRHADQIIYENL